MKGWKAQTCQPTLLQRKTYQDRRPDSSTVVPGAASCKDFQSIQVCHAGNNVISARLALTDAMTAITMPGFLLFLAARDSPNHWTKPHSDVGTCHRPGRLMSEYLSCRSDDLHARLKWQILSWGNSHIFTATKILTHDQKSGAHEDARHTCSHILGAHVLLVDRMNDLAPHRIAHAVPPLLKQTCRLLSLLFPDTSPSRQRSPSTAFPFLCVYTRTLIQHTISNRTLERWALQHPALALPRPRPAPIQHRSRYPWSTKAMRHAVG